MVIMGNLEKKRQYRQIVTTISITLNIVFICGTLFFTYKLYPKIKSRLSLSEIVTKAIQEVKPNKTDNSLPTVFFDASNFEIIGRLPNTEGYCRLPEDAKTIVRQPVWRLSKISAGISVRFASTSSKITIRWTSLNNNMFMNMTPIAANGFDLYAYSGNKWQFVGVAVPTGNKQDEGEIIIEMEPENREYLLNLPLYDGVVSLEIGIDQGASISKPVQKIINTSHPIVFYGTSITQGVSASRPGLTYPALLGRYFNKEVVNLGFSSNGRFEKELAIFFMTAQPSVIVLDCVPNSVSGVIRENLPKTIDYITSVNDTVPIILVESIVEEQNNALKEVYERKVKTRKNIYYVCGKKLIGEDHEATIDGTHFNDLGHFRAYEYLREEIAKILL